MVEFLRKLMEFFDKYSIPYMLSGGVAMGVHSLGRFTRDIDIIVMLRLEDVPVLVQSFKDGYYCDEDAVKEAIHQKGIFNIIDRTSHFKADLIIVKDSTFHSGEFSRRRLEDFMDLKVWLV